MTFSHTKLSRAIMKTVVIKLQDVKLSLMTKLNVLLALQFVLP